MYRVTSTMLTEGWENRTHEKGSEGLRIDQEDESQAPAATHTGERIPLQRMMNLYEDMYERKLVKAWGGCGGGTYEVDLHYLSVPLALGALQLAIEAAEKQNMTELVIITGNEKPGGGGIRKSVTDFLCEVDCEGFFNLDKHTNGRNLGRINIEGRLSIETCAANLRKIRDCQEGN